MARNLLVRDYLLLGLRLDRLLPGIVDSYTGDSALRRHAAGLLPDPVELLRTARRLSAELPDAGLDPGRQRFLAAQLTAVECAARRLAGHDIGFVEEVHACYDVVIGPGEPDDYRAVHRELDELLPGAGSLAERLGAFRRREAVGPERLGAAADALSEALRERTRAWLALPADEAVTFELVTDQPWSGLNRHLGDFRSHVTINTDAALRAAQLVQLIAHETYPGHHTQRCRAHAASGQPPERGMFLVGTPQSLLSEGAADLGLHVLVGPGWGSWSATVLAEVGVHTEGELGERVEDALAKLARVRQDAALLLHDRRGSAEDALAHLQRWLLTPEARARQLLRFLVHPLWRTYTTTYVEGVALLRPWLRRPGAGPLVRYRRLLDDPLVPASIRGELAGPRDVAQVSRRPDGDGHPGGL
ncbi:hypothetical protein PA7_33800 [Pseudonocardia asaccharolytica DSM 44247 = NBRC 16224]|uniref:DUF885 domain-containing protein n=1 Tax=Pseudonocardia asaccharolytica DSM 44247 = NBRC 16224 TaxID=1123024 RepID=A0A511D4Z3_9PSEU|nr:hypothetical protein PA7_33800 [Pseudonocardia asaccharolytica DSM 44247 = NBRC 16224]